MERQYHTHLGFTLLEIMVAISVIALLASMGYVSYQEFNRRQALIGANQTFRSNLRDIQSKASSGVKPTSGVCNSPNTLTGYQVSYINSTQYRSEAFCSAGATGIQVTYTLASGLQFHSSFATFQFRGLGLGLTPAVRVDNIRIRTTGAVPNAQTHWYSLCIAASGEIKECGYSKGTTVPSCITC
ncbi:MAG: prepilin-type N-terminal cleavage/methylation domain-containing protein [Patescibacteria group bacterium]